MPRPNHDEDSVTRRHFLDYALGLGLVGWLASVFYPVLRYLRPLQQTGTAGPTVLTREECTKLAHNHFVIVPIGNKRVLVFEDANQKIHALAAKCTHEGCTVQFMPRESIVWCACHNGHFDLDGRVISGPPPRPLDVYAVKREGAGNIIVSAETSA